MAYQGLAAAGAWGTGPHGASSVHGHSGLWVSELGAARIDYLGLSADHTSVTLPSIGMYGNQGVGGFDSNAVDADGHVYQCVINDGKVELFSSQGELIANIVAPQTMSEP
ncbi:SMP-30/gluconolactonase/LRE family protein [Streptomyces diastatochromogenes]|uniref:SMP-30/gluconolactonase/LRE family protein n=1 Tax=Streptomyces diastatochromogenes TaxID=42236 RepID=UPI00369D6FC7